MLPRDATSIRICCEPDAPCYRHSYSPSIVPLPSLNPNRLYLCRMSKAASPTRRVLGPKDSNAPMQRVTTKRPLSPARSPFTSPRAGKKRKIEEVHKAELPDSQETISTHSLSQLTNLLSDEQSDNGDGAQPSMTCSKSTLSTSLTSFRDSQEEAPQVEPEFHILEEPSQQSLDVMVCLAFGDVIVADHSCSMLSHSRRIRLISSHPSGPIWSKKRLRSA